MRKWIYIIFGLLLSVYIGYSFLNFHFGIAIVSATFFPACLLVFLYKIDVFERERFTDILVVFFLSFIVSYFICDYIWAPIRGILLGPLQDSFIYMLFGAGIPEEIIKIIPLLIILKRTKFINEPIDYLIYASASALGFAFLENIDYIYIYRDDATNIIAIRSLLPTFMHMACSSFFGFGIFFFMETKKIKYILIFFAIAASTHALYNSGFNLSGLGFLFPMLLERTMFIIIILYYARLIRSLINISPFYNQEKTLRLKGGSRFLGLAVLAVHISNIIFIFYYAPLNNEIYMQRVWLVDFGYIILAFIIYKIIAHNLKTNKGEFKILGKKRFKLFSEMQETIIKNYYAKIERH
jgi:RsiW-degrading membrane proteinase PrsW (M82 family)